MPRNPTRPLLPTLALLALTFLTPTLATALPQSPSLRSAAERLEAAPGLFTKFWDLLSAVWMNGSALEPDGANAGPSTDPNAGTTGDTGPGLEPNG